MATQFAERGIIPGNVRGPKYASVHRGEIERSYLAALLSEAGTDPGVADDCLEICPPEYVTLPDVAVYLRAIRDMRQEGLPPRLELLFDYMLRRHGQDPDNWPQPKAYDIAERVESLMGMWGNAAAHAAMVADAHRLSCLHAGLLEIAEGANFFGADVDTIAGKARELADSIGGVESTPDLSGIMARLMDKLHGEQAASLLKTPWYNLNRVLRGGFQGQELITLAGRPGTGKSALASCIAVDTAKQDKGVLFISREMGDLALLARMLSREARIDGRFFREGLAQGMDREKLTRVGASLQSLPISIMEKSRGRFCPREVRRLARGIKGLGLVVVDYLQLMQPDEPSKSREQEVSSMSRAFKTLAMDLNVPVLLLSQLNRSSEQADREPAVSDLRESGAIEQDADIILLLHTRKVERANTTPNVKCIIGKSRSTATGAVYFGFEKEFSNFVERDPREWTYSRPDTGMAAANDL